MRAITIAGLALMAMLALSAPAGAATALGTAETTLCSTESTPCPGSDQQSPGPLEATSSEVLISTSAVSVACSESLLRGETTAAAGAPLEVDLSVLSLSGCKANNLKETSCTTTEVQAPSGGELSWTSTGVGSLETGGETDWSFHLTCGVLINCTFELAPTYEASAGGLQASEVAADHISGGLCPSSMSYSGSYSVSVPKRFFVSVPAHEGSITATATDTEFVSSSYTWVCSDSSMTIEPDSSTGEPILGSVSSLTMSGCHFTNAKETGCTMSTEHLPYSASLTAAELTVTSGGDGNPGFHMVCGAVISCSMYSASVSLGTENTEGGVSFRAEGVGLKREGALCPAVISWSATYRASNVHVY